MSALQVTFGDIDRLDTYVYGTNKGCRRCTTDGTRDGWSGYSVYSQGGGVDDPSSVLS